MMNYKTWSRLLLFFVALSAFLVLNSCGSIPAWSIAVSQGDNATARTLILEAKDVKSRNTYGETPLMWASSVGDITLVSSLIDLGASINQQNEITGETPLVAAAKKGHADVVKLLISMGARTDLKDRAGFDALAVAVQSGKPDVLFVLLQAGCSIDVVNAGQFLVSASNAGDIKTVDHLLKLGTAINHQEPDGETALMAATKSGNISLVNTLLGKGANPDLADFAGRTAFLFAVQLGNLEIYDTLIATGANINSKDVRGNTPLMWAIMSGHQNVALELVKKNADVFATNAANKNALYLSAFDPEVARSLLNKKSSIVEVKVENNDFYGAALAYQWLGKFLETEMSEGRVSAEYGKIASIKAFEIAAKFFDSSAAQFSDIASDIRTKRTLRVVGSVLLTVASVAVGTMAAQQQANQMSELSALKSSVSGGSGVGIGYGVAPVNVINLNKSPLVSAEDFDSKAGEMLELAQVCRAKAACYRRVGNGKFDFCFK